MGGGVDRGGRRGDRRRGPTLGPLLRARRSIAALAAERDRRCLPRGAGHLTRRYLGVLRPGLRAVRASRPALAAARELINGTVRPPRHRPSPHGTHALPATKDGQETGPCPCRAGLALSRV